MDIEVVQVVDPAPIITWVEVQVVQTVVVAAPIFQDLVTIRESQVASLKLLGSCTKKMVMHLIRFE